MVSTSEARLCLIGDFPALTDSNFGLTSPRDRTYNCIAWAADDNTRWWWPGHPYGYWPDPSARNELASFQAAFENLGFAICSDGTFVEGMDKVAIYAIGNEPKHAARQMIDGRWTSKLGQSWDIWHELEALNGPSYGAPVLFLSRARPL